MSACLFSLRLAPKSARCFLVAASLLFSATLPAATWTWTGATNNNWTNGGNWSPATSPTSSSATILNFNTSSSGISNNNNLLVFTVGQINFGPILGNFSITGNGLNFAGVGATLTNNDTTGVITINNSINLSTALGPTINFTINGASGAVTHFTGTISDTLLGPPDDSVTVAGGTVNFENAASSYGGGLAITGGTAVATSNSSITISSNGTSFFGTGTVNETGGRLIINAMGASSNLTVNRTITLASSTATGANSNLFTATGNITIGSAANITLNNGSTLALQPGVSGIVTIQGANFNFGQDGGILDLRGPLSTNYTGQVLNVNTTGTNQATIQYASINASNAWALGSLPFFIGDGSGSNTNNNLTGTGNLTLSMTNGALTQYAQGSFGGAVTFSGVAAGSASVGSTATNVGRLVFDPSYTSGTTITVSKGIFFKNTNQVSLAYGNNGGTATATTVANNITIQNEETAFSGSSQATGLTQGRLSLGSSSNNTLTVNNGGTATLDFGFRTDATSGFNSGVVLNASTILNAGGTLQFTKSANISGVTYDDIFINSPITGQGTAATGESIINFSNSIGGVVTTATAANQVVVGSAVALYVQGSGINGLRVQGSQANVDGLLTSAFFQTQLKSVAGSTTNQGTLTIAYNNNGSRTFTNSEGPATPSYVQLGFDIQSGSSPVYTLNNAAGGVGGSTLSNWDGIVVKGGTVQLAANATFTGASGAAGFTIQGGTFRLDNGAGVAANSTFAGAASLQAGTIAGGPTAGTLTIQANATKTTVGTVFLGGKIVVNGSIGLDIQQGTLSQTASNLIGDSTKMRLSGGTWATNGNSETLGTLTLAANSTLNVDSGSIIRYANSASTTWTSGTTLSITNWQGNPVVGGGSTQVYFGTNASGLTAAQINQIVFVNPAGFGSGTYAGVLLANGEFVPVPEPSTVLSGIALSCFVIGYEIRRRKSPADF